MKIRFDAQKVGSGKLGLRFRASESNGATLTVRSKGGERRDEIWVKWKMEGGKWESMFTVAL